MDESLIWMYEGVGSLLSGHPLTLLLERPAGNEQGTLSRQGKRAFVRMRNDLDIDLLWWLFLHETAHAKKHLKGLGSSNLHELPAGSRPATEYSVADLVHEDEASEQATRWYIYADLCKPVELDQEMGRLIALIDLETGSLIDEMGLTTEFDRNKVKERYCDRQD